MSEEQRAPTGFWADLRRHPAFQTALVFGGGSWLALQAADIFGLETSTVRWLGGGFVLVFVALMGFAALKVARQRSGGESIRAGMPTRLVLASVLALLLLGSGAWVARPFILKSAVRPGADVIAVLPFQASGPSVELLGEGLVDLLTTNLDEVGAIRTVHPRTTLHQYRQQSPQGTVDLAGALRVGRAVAAGSVLLGSVVAVGPEVRITAELHAVEDGRVIARAQKTGEGDNVLTLVDELSIELMRDIWRSREPLPQLRVSAITTPSIAAIRAYMRGEQHYRRLQWDSAAVAFGEAVAHDSTFALAHFRLGETYGWQESLGSEVALRHSTAAARFADRLPARDRALVLAHQLHESGSVAAIDSFQAYVQRYPDDVAGWYMLADARFHAAGIMGFSLDSLRRGFERAHELDPTYAQPYAHMFELALLQNDSVGYRQYLASFDEHVGGQTDVFHVIRDVRWAPGDEALAVVDRATRSGATMMNRIGMAATIRAFDGTPDTEFLLNVIAAATRAMPREQAEATMASQKAVVLASSGRFRDADAALETVRRTSLDYSTGMVLPFIVSGMAPEVHFGPERDLLRRAPARRSASYWRAVQALTHGDVATAGREITAARRDTAATGGEVSADLVDALDAWLAAVQGDSTAVTRLKRALIAHGYSPRRAGPAGIVRLNLAIMQARHPATRAEAINRLEMLRMNDLGIAPLVLVPLAEAYAADGQRDRAAETYNRFLALWQSADPEVQSQVESARNALQRLGADRASS